MPRYPDPKSKTQQLILKAKPHQIEKVIAFKEVCRRDGLEINEELYKAVEEFLKKHNWPPGNPQKTLFEPATVNKPKYKTRKNLDIYCPTKQRWKFRANCLSYCNERETCEISIALRND